MPKPRFTTSAPALLGAAVLLLLAGCSAPDDIQAPELAPTGGTASVVPGTGLIGEWKLDTTGTATVAVDTKNGYNATVVGGAAFVAGHLGNALDLNNGTTGTGGKYAEMPSNATLDDVQENNYTISAWFYPYSVPQDSAVSNRSWAIVVKAGQHLGLVYESDQRFAARHYLTGDALVRASSSTQHPINAWYHVASVVSRTQGTVKVYVNGTLRGTAMFQGNTAAKEYNQRAFRIGKAQTTWAANGKVDQVRIYNRALDSAEVVALATETASAPPTATTNAATTTSLTKATLNGSANPNGTATTGYFRYSTSSPGTCNNTFGTATPGTSLGSGTTAASYNRGLSELVGGALYYYCAIATNASGTSFGQIQSFRAGGVQLRAGLLSFDSLGKGPGGDAGAPIYRFTQIVAQPSEVNALIAEAEQHDIILMLNLARNRNQWITNGAFDSTKYANNVRAYAGNDSLTNAIQRRRVLLWVIDEANHSSFNGTISPTMVNNLGRLHKEIWPGALTFVRMSGSTLTNRWDDQNGNTYPAPVNGYTGLDYGWAQRSAQHNNTTLNTYFQDERDKLDALDMGMVPGLNWWAGGIRQNLDGVTACWDTEDDGGTDNGYIVGTQQTGEGTHYSCGNLPTGVNRVVASPEWIKRWADVVFNDANAPFVAIWRDALDSSTIPGAEDLAARDDFVEALDHVLTKAATRPSWNGFRPAKVLN